MENGVLLYLGQYKVFGDTKRGEKQSHSDNLSTNCPKFMFTLNTCGISKLIFLREDNDASPTPTP